MPETLTPSASSADAAGAGSPTDANSSATSSTAESGAKPAPSLKDHLFKGDTSIKAKMAADEESPASDTSRKTDDGKTSLDPAKKAGEEAAADPNQKPEAPKPLTDEEEKALPFHKHPRWQQMKNENAELREKFAQEEPKAKAYDDFVGKVTDAKLNGRDLDELLNVGKTLKHDPKAAHAYLVKYVHDLGIQLGITLPPDIKKRVEDGYLSEEDAQRLAEAEAGTKLTAAQLQQQQEQDRIDGETTAKNAKKTALSTWEFNWKANDPDYDQLQPDVEDRFLRLAKEKPPKTAEDITALADQALKDIRARRKLPPPKAVKPPVQSGASVTTQTVPKTMREAILQAGRNGRK